MKKYFTLYGVGSFASLLTTLLGFLIEREGGMTILGTTLSLQFSAPVLYGRLCWGGLWGLGYSLPGIRRLSWLQAGCLISLLPTLTGLLYVFPKSGEGWFGLSKGLATPVVIILANLLWGWITAYFASRSKALV